MSNGNSNYPRGAFWSRILAAAALALGLWLGLREVGRIGANTSRENYQIFREEQARISQEMELNIRPITQVK